MFAHCLGFVCKCLYLVILYMKAIGPEIKDGSIQHKLSSIWVEPPDAVRQRSMVVEP